MTQRHVLFLGPYLPAVIRFRKNLLQDCAAADCRLTVVVPNHDLDDLEILSSIPAHLVTYPIHRSGLNPLKDLSTWLSLLAIFHRQKADVVLAFTIKPIIWGGLALWFIRKPCFFALITGLGYAFQPGSGRGLVAAVASWLYKLSLLRAHKVIFQNEDNLNEFVARGIVPRSKCERVFGSGVDLTHYAIQPLPAGNPVFLCIGRLLGDKGLREYVKAAELVKAKYPAVRLQWIGATDPSPDGIPLSVVQAWHDREVIEYLGETRDVRPFIAACHVFVLPSYHEGLPRSTLEAMAMGRPVLTTDVSGCRDTVIPDENGFLVPKADADALAERMIWFIEHPERWQGMGEASRRMAEQRFDVDSVNAEMLRIMNLSSSS